MDAEPNPIDEHMDVLAGTTMIYQARIEQLKRTPIKKRTLAEWSELFELKFRLNQLNRDRDRILEKYS